MKEEEALLTGLACHVWQEEREQAGDQEPGMGARELGYRAGLHPRAQTYPGAAPTCNPPVNKKATIYDSVCQDLW